ncbi:hypothetical protein LY78DRAFT_657604 [Colletotrichum sublineola]|uniref:Uncharacterized protein n=1 Tax=Colletotrichum sublineola TaxID=1173701 RepID=A0A066XR93_COLSU|nr:hypothetical protein LY78DRAFT_657604 [Colletotrichum sublineola]KDN70189.1 hypothetical protein CSUB01_07852 [Colletotrichum sublineola]
MTLLTEMAPLVWTRPAPGSDAAFREDEFVSLWCEIYTMLLRLNFWKRQDMIFPSADTGRHTELNRESLLDAQMSPEVISLLERLPYARIPSYYRLRVYPEADIINYLEDDIKDCRDPYEMAQYSARPDSLTDASYLLPQDVALARPAESDGLAWILDVSYNAFRFVSGPLEAPARGLSGLPADYPVERPDDPDHYRNWPMYHAPTVLRRWIQDVHNLELVPASSMGEYWSTSSDILGQVIGKALRRYGWPAEFREQDWARDSEQIHHAATQVEQRYEEEFNPHEFGRDRQELISRWKEDPDLIPYAGLEIL